jgi:hypothetical protein
MFPITPPKPRRKERMTSIGRCKGDPKGLCRKNTSWSCIFCGKFSCANHRDNKNFSTKIICLACSQGLLEDRAQQKTELNRQKQSVLAQQPKELAKREARFKLWIDAGALISEEERAIRQAKFDQWQFKQPQVSNKTLQEIPPLLVTKLKRN